MRDVMPNKLSNPLAGLTAFVAVARALSYSQAARALGVTNSAVSQAVSGFEDALGVKLLNRTTRKVALTGAGRQLLEEAGPGLVLVEQALQAVASRAKAPRGRLRINTSRLAARLLVVPHLAKFQATYPDIELDLQADDRLVDIADDAFDAGIRAGRTLAPGMVARPLGPVQRLVVVAAPGYLRRAGTPLRPDAIATHRCIRFQPPGGGQVREWEFEVEGTRRRIAPVRGPVLNDSGLAMQAALAGAGLGQHLHADVATALREGRLVEVLQTFACEAGRYHVYYPSRRHVPARLRVFVAFLDAHNPPQAAES